MIVGLVDKLLDRCIQLINAKKKLRHDLFNGFVQPVFSQFEAVHNFYLNTFNNYIKLLDDPALDLIDLYTKIKQDNLFSEHLRLKLNSLTQTSDNKKIQKFVKSIHDYLVSKEDCEPYPLPFLQRWESVFMISSGIAKEIRDGKININAEYPKPNLDEQRKVLADFGFSNTDIERQIDALNKQQAAEANIQTWGDYKEELEKRKIDLKLKAYKMLEKTVFEMQTSYKSVVTEYSILKNQLA